MFQKMLQVGSGGVEPSATVELIWQNSNLGTNFSAQTITESTSGWVSGKVLADYDGVIIVFTDTTANKIERGRTIIFMGDSLYGAGYVNNTVARSRNFSLSASGIVVENAADGGNSGRANIIIPSKIYGFKGISLE